MTLSSELSRFGLEGSTFTAESPTHWGRECLKDLLLYWAHGGGLWEIQEAVVLKLELY